MKRCTQLLCSIHPLFESRTIRNTRDASLTRDLRFEGSPPLESELAGTSVNLLSPRAFKHKPISNRLALSKISTADSRGPGL
jgi:hypothetical protein